MKILAVDTSTAMATAAVTEDGKLLALSSAMSPKGHSQRIFGLLEKVLEESNVTIDNIDVFVCSVGPGSFTGLRIGATAVTGLAHGMKKKLIGLPTLDVLAAGFFGFGGYVCPILDAQRSSVYSALYFWDNGLLNKVEDFGVVEIDKLEDKIHTAIFDHISEEAADESVKSEFEEFAKLYKVLFCGDAVPLFIEKIKDFKNMDVLIAPGERIYPSAGAAAWLAKENIKNAESSAEGKAESRDDGRADGRADGVTDGESILSEPGALRLEYIRKAQAEVEYSHRNPINIRIMELEDIDQVHEIENLSFAIPWSLNSFKMEMENSMALYIVAEVGGRIAGYAGLWQIIDEGHITNVAVHPGFQGMGIGEKLMKELIEESKKRCLSSMTLEVRINNLPAINLYKKLDFDIEGLRKGYYTDTNEDGLIMWLRMKD